MFAEGGNMDNNRTAMPAHPATNPYKRRSWETDEEYKERIQDLDNKSQHLHFSFSFRSIYLEFFLKSDLC